MEKIGIFKAKSDATQGVCIDEVWYNTKKNVWEFLQGMNLEKGEKVRIKEDNRDITFIERAKDGAELPAQQPAEPQTQIGKQLPEKDLQEFMPANEYKLDREEAMAKMCAMNNSVEFAKLHPTKEPPWTPDDIKLIARNFFDWIMGK